MANSDACSLHTEIKKAIFFPLKTCINSKYQSKGSPKSFLCIFLGKKSGIREFDKKTCGMRKRGGNAGSGPLLAVPVWTFHVDCNVIYWFNSSQLIRVDKCLIIKDTNSKIDEVIRQPCMNRFYQLCCHKIDCLIVSVSLATIVSIFCVDT